MTSRIPKAALEQLRAARQGESRIDQYVVEEQKKIVEEVGDDEYRKIIAERRDDFVVGDANYGYNDGGREIWEDPEAIRERQRENQKQEVAPGAKSQVTGAKKSDSAQGQADASTSKHEAALFGAFKAGARSGNTSSAVLSEPASAPIRDAHRQQELDDMLKEMCGSLEARDIAPKPPAATAPPSTAGVKRKQEVVDRHVAAKKTMIEPKVEQDVKIKHEPIEASQDVVRDAACNMSADVKVECKSEPNVKMEPACDDVDAMEEDHGMVDTMVAPGTACKPLLEADGGMWFYLVDSFEDDRSNPPRVFLFGKLRVQFEGSSIPSHQSCCLVVENLERCVHLMLNAPDQHDDAAVAALAQHAEQEFDQYCERNCPKVRKLRAKLKWRNYAFEKALPQGHGNLPTLKVVMDAAGGKLTVGMKGQAFNHVFGEQTSLLERLLITRRIKGPSWLRLEPNSFTENPAKLSFCALELRIRPSSITAPKTAEHFQQLSDQGMPVASPPLRVLSLSMQTLQRSAQHEHEPVVIACTLLPAVSSDASDSEKDLQRGMSKWAAVRRFDSQPLPRDSERVLPQRGIQHFSSETAMFNALLAKIMEFDPDVIVGHNAYGFDLDVIASRMSSQKLQCWQKLGRLRRAKVPMPRIDGKQGAGFWMGSNLTAGRLVCDVLLQAKDLLPKLTNYDLPSLAREQLNVGNMQEIQPEDLLRHYDSANSLATLADVTLNNSVKLAQLMHSLQILPLSKQLTNVAGNSWNSSLQNKRADRNEMLLCHEFHKKKFILPDKETAFTRARKKAQQGGGGGLDDPFENDQAAAAPGPRRGKAMYSGGLVLEPQVGLYDDFVMMLDFNSLYPSVIQEYNICFTTVERPNEDQVAQFNSEAELLAATEQPDSSDAEGVLPLVLRRLVESRRQVKSEIKSTKDPRRLQRLEIRQKALKLTANSMYGCLGFQFSRFHARPLAALVTKMGRQALESTINIVKHELVLDVVYGDTDSVFVNSKTKDFAAAMKIAEQIKRSVNKKYKRLEIEIDGVFGKLLLLKKKKYAGLKVIDKNGKKEYEPEIKGLDIVRRDWCNFAKKLGEDILNTVLSGPEPEAILNEVHQMLTDAGKAMDESKVPTQKYAITKALTKAPQDYPDAKHQPHVQVALRMMSRGKAVRPGQDIEYVICDVECEGPSYAERARHPQEFELDPTLRVDVAWYKSQQVHPLITRLLGPIDGTDPARQAECLGMDGTRFARAAAAAAGVSNHSFSEAAADITELFDRKSRWKQFESCLEGAKDEKGEVVSWRQLLKPENWETSGVSVLFRSPTGAAISPKMAQNQFVMQLRKMTREYSEGWVNLGGGEHHVAGIERTRRIRNGENAITEQQLLQELEFLEYLCDSAAKGMIGEDDVRGCRVAAAGMQQTCRWLLESNGFNWVDCGKFFGSLGRQ